jgi:Helicase conserved C-terminal domain
MTDPSPNAAEPVPAFAPQVVSPNRREAYRAALKRYDVNRLREIVAALGLVDRSLKVNSLIDEIEERLVEPRLTEIVLTGLPASARVALTLFAITEAGVWPMLGLAHSLRCLGIDPVPAVMSLLSIGLLAARIQAEGAIVRDLDALFESSRDGSPIVELHAHPSALASARTTLPEGLAPPTVSSVSQIREADGLEAIVRMAALWQRVVEAPLRQTQTGQLYKRDRDRLEDDPVLAGPIADALEPLPDMAALWQMLAMSVGLIVHEPGTDRVVAAPAEFWAENAVHLPQMIASRWQSLRNWHEQLGMQEPGSPVALALPFVRPALLLWLATVGEAHWVALDDLAEHLSAHMAGWHAATLGSSIPDPLRASINDERAQSSTPRKPARNDVALLEAVLLGPAYQLGLVRAAEEVPNGRRVVQLTPLGRYVLALGPPPPPRPAFEKFLFVQPNFEVIAYRQGLNPSLVGHFSRFTLWSQVGAALEWKLTPESVYRGLEGGLTPEHMLERLAKHSSRPLPPGVAEALRTWANRRERITYYAAATLIEFATPEALELALTAWPADERSAPVRVSERLLLIEDEKSIPFHRFRLTGSRDYRRPAEPCLDVEPDGVTLALDLGRSDLLVDAELARFADELPSDDSKGPSGSARRRFQVSPASLARAAADGFSPALLTRWFPERTGSELTPALRLLLYAMDSRAVPFRTNRLLVLHAPTAELLDGLAQHPMTCNYFGDRLGPTVIVVSEDEIEQLRRALGGLGLALDDESNSLSPANPPLRIKRS